MSGISSLNSDEFDILVYLAERLGVTQTELLELVNTPETQPDELQRLLSIFKWASSKSSPSFVPPLDSNRILDFLEPLDLQPELSWLLGDSWRRPIEWLQWTGILSEKIRDKVTGTIFWSKIIKNDPLNIVDNRIIKNNSIQNIPLAKPALPIIDKEEDFIVDTTMRPLGNFSPPGTESDIKNIRGTFPVFERDEAWRLTDSDTITPQFEPKFSEEILKGLERDNAKRFTESDPNISREARNYMRKNFWASMYLLFATLANSPERSDDLRQYITGKEVGTETRIAERYRISLERLKEQRDLTFIEEAYIESVEQLSVFNPYLVWTISEAPGESYEFLCNHFDALTDTTWSDLKPWSYVPQIQIGTWPEWLSFFGEQTRISPSLSANTLVVDKWDQPGWPFAIPEWPAWELNSSNPVLSTVYNLTDKPENEVQEKRRVRAYASPLKWYPWERTVGSPDARLWPINSLVDFGVEVSMLNKNRRYATNEDLQLVLAANAATLMQKVCMKTELISSEPSGRPLWEWTELVTLRRTFKDGRIESKKIYTDYIVNATWLGDEGYGFPLTNDKKATDIVRNESNINGFPVISTALQAKNFINSRRDGAPLPETIIISWRWGDTSWVLVEDITRLFESDSGRIRWVKKIYLVGTKELSQRPRYLKLKDVLSRTNKWWLVEEITARVADVGYESEEESKVCIYNEEGEQILDSRWGTISADCYISATGPKSKINNVYSAYWVDWKIKRENISLPTNRDVSVGQVIEWRKNISFAGTGAEAQFDEAKLSQLPEKSRKVLEKVGPENWVAIGFRSPEAQASARISTPKKLKVLSPESLEDESTEKKPIRIKWDYRDWEIPLDTWILNTFHTLDNVGSSFDMMTALLAYEMTHAWVRLPKRAHQMSFRVALNTNHFSVKVEWKDGVSNSIKKLTERAFSNPRVHSYMHETLSKYKKRNKDMMMKINITEWGKISFSHTRAELV